MWKLLAVLAILGAAEALRIITRNMIRTPEDRGLLEYQRVPLRTKGVREETRVLEEARVLEEPGDLEEAEVLEEARVLEEATTTESPQETTESAARRTTMLYPVAGLWEDRQLLEPDLWSILRNAYLCLFAGFDCFSSRVFPLVKSFIGYQPQYPFPRAVQLGKDDQVLMTKLTKELLIGLLLVSLPWLSGVSLATGRALVSGLLAYSTRQPYYM